MNTFEWINGKSYESKRFEKMKKSCHNAAENPPRSRREAATKSLKSTGGGDKVGKKSKRYLVIIRKRQYYLKWSEFVNL